MYINRNPKINRTYGTLLSLIMPFLIYYSAYLLANMMVPTMIPAWVELWEMQGQKEAKLGGICMVIGVLACVPMICEEVRRKKDLPEHVSGCKMEPEGEPDNKEAKSQQVAMSQRRWIPILIALPVMYTLIYNILLTKFPVWSESTGFAESAQKQLGVSLGVGVLLFGIISPVAEETVFRFLLQSRLKQSYRKDYFAVFGSAFLFAVYHGNPVQGMCAFGAGLLLGLLFARTENILYCIAAHAIANVIVFYSNKNDSFYSIMISNAMLVGLIGLFLCGVGVMLADALLKDRDKKESSG